MCPHAVRIMQASGEVPPAVNDARCDEGSLTESLLPTGVRKAVRLRGMQTRVLQVNDLRSRRGCED